MTKKDMETLRQEYDNKNYKIPFGAIYGGLRVGKSLMQIAKEQGVSRQYMSQIYIKHFKPLFPYASPKERIKVLTQKHRLKEFYKGNPLMTLLAKRCESSSYSFKPVPTKQGSYKRSRAIINGHLCAILGTAKPAQHVKQDKVPEYTRLQCSRDAVFKCDFIICYQKNTELFFIYPTAVLAAAYSFKNGSMMIYIPMKFTTDQRKPSHIEHKKYVENWSLLKK